MTVREIKFRGMDVNGRWFKGLLSISQGKSNQPKLGSYISNSAGSPWAYQVRPETVGQYTGLKDELGNEIYEGDILKIPDLYETPENTATTYHDGIIDFKNFTFNLDGYPLGDDYEYISDECEVIGNIHENSDLLSKEAAESA